MRGTEKDTSDYVTYVNLKNDSWGGNHCFCSADEDENFKSSMHTAVWFPEVYSHTKVQKNLNSLHKSLISKALI